MLKSIGDDNDNTNHDFNDSSSNNNNTHDNDNDKMIKSDSNDKEPVFGVSLVRGAFCRASADVKYAREQINEQIEHKQMTCGHTLHSTANSGNERKHATRQTT